MPELIHTNNNAHRHIERFRMRSTIEYIHHPVKPADKIDGQFGLNA